MPGDDVGPGRVRGGALRARIPVDLHVDLFGHRPRLPGVDPLDPAVYDVALRAARRDAVHVPSSTASGIAGLLRLGAAATLPVAVGWAAAEVRGDDLADEPAPAPRDGRPGRLRSRAVTPERASKLTAWTGWSGSSSAGPTASPSPSRPGSCSRSRGRARPSSRSSTASTPMSHASFWQRMARCFVDPDARPLVARQLMEHGAPGARSTCS